MSYNILKIGFLLLIFFLIGELGLTAIRYGLPGINLFKTVPGYCKILEDKYCKLGKVTRYVSNGKSYMFMGFSLPPTTKVPIYSPSDGLLILGTEASRDFHGKSANVRTLTGENYDIRGNIDLSRFGNVNTINIKSGSIIGYASSSPNKSLGNYDIVFTVSRATSAGPQVIEALLKNLFKL